VKRRLTVAKRQKRYLAIAIVVTVLVLIEVVSYVLQRPNRIDLDGDEPFLLQTTWHQAGDYAQFIPTGEIAGCWSTALAQIAHYHRLNPTGSVRYETSSGLTVSIDLNAYHFRHGQFAPRIDRDTPAATKEQIATYIYYVAGVIHKDFAGDGYLDHDTFIDRLEDHLQCAAEFHEYDKDAYLRDEAGIRSLVAREIDDSRPMMLYFDNGKDFGHAAVIDGYTEVDGAFLVHLNMGWGGRHDGWYDLFDRIAGVRDDLQTRFLITIDPTPDGG
jgi:hypothetical protein